MKQETRGSIKTAIPTTKLLKVWPYRVTFGHSLQPYGPIMSITGIFCQFMMGILIQSWLLSRGLGVFGHMNTKQQILQHIKSTWKHTGNVAKKLYTFYSLRSSMKHELSHTIKCYGIQVNGSYSAFSFPACLELQMYILSSVLSNNLFLDCLIRTWAI